MLNNINSEKRTRLLDKLQQGTEQAKSLAERYSGIRGTFRALGEQTGYLSRQDEPYTQLPLREKMRLHLKSLPSTIKKVATETAKGIAKFPIKAGLSMARIPKTLATGRAEEEPVSLPWIGEVPTYYKDLERNIAMGMDPKVAYALSASEGTLGVASLGLGAQRAQAAIKSILKPKLQTRLNPKMANTIVKDAQKQVVARGIAGARNPRAALKLGLIDLSKIRSWGDLYTQMINAVGNDARAISAVKNHLKTRWGMYIAEPETAIKVMGPEFINR